YCHGGGLRVRFGEYKLRLRSVELERAADQCFWFNEAEQHIGIGQGWHVAALVVADRARLGTRALRTDLQGAARVDPYVRPAASTDLGEVDRRDFQSVARPREQARADHDAGADRIFVRAR